jgi:hypothetical protein
MEIHKREDYDIDFIESLITNEVEESINIDFKACGALSKEENKKKEISKDVSAFANSNGGIIIYGISEKNHKADAISFINGNEFTKEWLEQVISSTIQRNIPGLKIFPIRNKGRIEETIYIVQIPESIEAPHICKDKKFYKRYDFQSVAMDEYEIRNLYGRKTKAKLQISGYRISPVDQDNRNILRLYFVTGVDNIGECDEEKYKVNVIFDNFYLTTNLNWEQSGDSIHYTHTILSDEISNRVKISNYGKAPIYPNERVDILRFNIDIKKETAREQLNDLSIVIKLNYSGGFDEIKFDIKDMLEKLIAAGTI